MKHLTDEQLTALYYGDDERAEALQEHLRSCRGCRDNFQSLQHTLGAFKSAPIPERDPSYGSQVWYAIAQRLDAPQTPPARQRVAWFSVRRLAAVGALAAVIILAFVAGRYWPRKPIQTVAADSAQIRQGVLLVAVSDHLDHAQMVLMELANADGDGAARGTAAANVNIATEQARAQQLLISNRLYEQTAQQTGDAEIQNILSALEPVLLEIAHSPDEISSREFEQIQDRIRGAGILFKVRVVSSDVRDKERSLARRNGQGQT
ncbi:MAG TPA: hypothetical protein VGS59_13375 [Candidatus Acidoferrales bacterium]|nr:hypothetical protein [Candidatus Acidoferrales bacterium]